MPTNYTLLERWFLDFSWNPKTVLTLMLSIIGRMFTRKFQKKSHFPKQIPKQLIKFLNVESDAVFKNLWTPSHTH